MRILLICALCAVAFVSLTSADCFIREEKVANHTWSPKKTSYFEYEGKKYGVDSSFTDIDKCMHCDCSSSGCRCCGIGYYAGMMADLDCAIVPDGCEIAILNLEKTALCDKD